MIIKDEHHFQILRISMIKSFPTTHQKASWRQETTLIILWSYIAQSNDEKKARQISMTLDENWWALPLTCTNVTRTIAVFHLLLPKFIPHILMQLCLNWYRCNPGKSSFQGRITLQMSTLLSNAQRRASEEAGFLITTGCSLKIVFFPDSLQPIPCLKESKSSDLRS